MYIYIHIYIYIFIGANYAHDYHPNHQVPSWKALRTTNMTIQAWQLPLLIRSIHQDLVTI